MSVELVIVSLVFLIVWFQTTRHWIRIMAILLYLFHLFYLWLAEFIANECFYLIIILCLFTIELIIVGTFRFLILIDLLIVFVRIIRDIKVLVRFLF
nr:hypothetical protein SMV_SGL_HYP [Sphenigellan virus]